MIDIAQKIHKLISDSISKNDGKEIIFKIEHPADLNYGDYSTNAALILAKKIGDETGKKVNPKQVADLLVEKMSANLPAEVSKIEVAGPGFINFHLNSEFFRNSINEILEEEQEFGKNHSLRNQKILVEYTDPNPLKQFHIGHLMSNAIGESVARIFSWNGANVTRMCYQGDVGMHVAKALFGILNNIDALPGKTASLDEKMKFLGEAYVHGAEMFEGDSATEESKKVILEINRKVYEFYDEAKNTDTELEFLYELGKKWSLQHFEEIYLKLGTSFDYFVMESSTFQIGEKIVRENLGKVFEESEGAIIYRGENEGLHTRVFINSSGLPLYESKDLGLAVYKHKLVEHDKSIIVTADEQKEYFKVVLSALSKIEPEISKKTVNVTHGMMQFAEGKMSSRKGNVITGEALLSEIENMVAEKIKGRNFNQADSETIKNQVSVAALKYSILKQSPGKNIVFNPEQAISFEGDSGPYVQYTYTRAKSVMEKALTEKKIPNPKKLPEGWETTKLEKLVYQFPELIIKSLQDLEPHHIVTYMTQVASEFNSYYGHTQILDGTPNEGYKLALARATMVVLKNSLTVLGIKAPERM